MILEFDNAKPATNSDDNLIPLINVVFLMLIFFMVAGHIEASDGTPVAPPLSKNKTEAKQDALKVVVSANSDVFVDGKVLSLEELEAYFSHYRERLPQSESNHPLIELKADGQLTAASLQAILLKIKSAGFIHISLVTEFIQS